MDGRTRRTRAITEFGRRCSERRRLNPRGLPGDGRWSGRAIFTQGKVERVGMLMRPGRAGDARGEATPILRARRTHTRRVRCSPGESPRNAPHQVETPRAFLLVAARPDSAIAPALPRRLYFFYSVSLAQVLFICETSLFLGGKVENFKLRGFSFGETAMPLNTAWSDRAMAISAVGSRAICHSECNALVEITREGV